ncbi:hypothetical protein SBC2_84940 (plasmid) [Caballeronia sp. SBC2]|nr:hypothetical protein SBC2_84940 [Caballeronia sp. SBC2]
MAGGAATKKANGSLPWNSKLSGRLWGSTRVRLHATRGFPTGTMHRVVDVARLAIKNNMSARARLVEVIYATPDKPYDIFVGTGSNKPWLKAVASQGQVERSLRSIEQN